MDDQEEPIAIEELVRPIARLSAPDFGVRELGHGVSGPIRMVTRELPWKLTPARGKVSTKAIERRRGYFSGFFCRFSPLSACSRMSANKVWRLGSESNRRRRLCRPTMPPTDQAIK